MATCLDGEQIWILLRGPKEVLVHHFSPGYSLWFPKGAIYAPSWQCFKRSPKGQFMHFISHNPVFKKKQTNKAERIWVEEGGSLSLPFRCPHPLTSEPGSMSDHDLAPWILQSGFHRVTASLGSWKVLSSPPNIINCWLIQVCANLILWPGKTEQRESGWQGSLGPRVDRGAGFWAPQKRQLYRLALCNSLHSMWYRTPAGNAASFRCGEIHGT